MVNVSLFHGLHFNSLTAVYSKSGNRTTGIQCNSVVQAHHSESEINLQILGQTQCCPK